MSEHFDVTEYIELPYIDTGVLMSPEDFLKPQSTIFRLRPPRRLEPQEIYQGNKLIACLIPCQRISDGAIGFYDTVKNQFHEVKKK